MIDPSKITNFNLNKYELEEHAIFWLLVAGKTAKTTAKLLDNLLKNLHSKYGYAKFCPFEVIKRYEQDYPGGLSNLLKESGFGCYNLKARGILELVNKGLNLRKCTVEQLEAISCIGPKTARCFIMHTRPNTRLAGLDVHVLKFLKDLGYSVPKNTPTGKRYKQVEELFLKIADALNMTPTELDLDVWNAYSSGGKYEVGEKL